MSKPTVLKAATKETRSGTLTFDASGYLADKSIDHLYDEIAFHGATQAYLWAVSVLVNDQWRRANLKVAGPMDWVTYTGVDQIGGILTPNMTTPYVIAYPNLAETGPLLYNVPAGPTGGIINDFEHRLVTDTGYAGPDKGQGATYLILHERMQEPEGHGADFVVRSRTNIIRVGIRLLTDDPNEKQRLIEESRLHPFGVTAENKVVEIGDTEYQGWHPDGMDFWTALHDILQIEDFPEEDRYVLQFLQRVGIEKGKPFEPTERQLKILIEAATVGSAMAETLSTARERMYGTFYDDGSHWTVHMSGLSNAQHLNENGMKELDGVVSYSWEAVAISDGMLQDLVGVGSKYLATYRDANGDWLYGSNTYQLTIPPDVPMKQFWAVNVYPRETRALIVNKDNKPGISSFDDVVANDDGSYTLTFGPTRPENVPSSNFTYTNEGEGWFTYFRVYAPTEAYFNKTWRLPDIQKVE